MRTLQVQVNEGEYISSFLQILNGLLKLTDKELEVLRVFLSVNPKDPNGPEFKTRVVKDSGMKNVAVLNNYIKKFRDKGILISNESGVNMYNPILDPDNFRKGFCIKFVQK